MGHENRVKGNSLPDHVLAQAVPDKSTKFLTNEEFDYVLGPILAEM